MRQGIETAPKDGDFIILEDDAKGTYDVGHWSIEAGGWVGKDDEPIKITPTHWHPFARNAYFQADDDGSAAARPVSKTARLRSLAAIAAVIAAAAALFYPLRQETAQPVDLAVRDSKVAQDARPPGPDLRTSTEDLRTPQREVRPPVEQEQTVRRQQAAVAPVSNIAQSGNQKPTESARLDELGEARRTIERLEAQRRAETTAEQEALKQERERSAALAEQAAAARQELTAGTAQHGKVLGEERTRYAALAKELATARREIETQTEQLRQVNSEMELSKQAEVTKTRQLLDQHRQSAAALAEAAAAREELKAGTSQHDRALDAERARSAALESELATARRENEALADRSHQAGSETVSLRQADSAKTEQVLEQQRQKEAAIAEATAARQALETRTAQHRLALDEEKARNAALASELATAQQLNEKLAAQFRVLGEQAEVRRRADEAEIAALQQSLRDEREGAMARAAELDAMRRAAAARIQPEAATGSPAPQQVASAGETVMASPAASGQQDGAEAARMIARAGALLGQGDIGAARIVLERAAELGSARAAFMLGETYDPGILLAWKTYGTRGEANKARELYAKAHDGGIREAKARLDALGQ